MERSRARRIGRLLVGVLLVGVLCAGAGYGYWVFVNHRFAPVTEGQFYRSGAMPPETLQDIVRQYGIRTVIDFRESEYEDKIAAEHSALSRIGVQHFSLPSKQVPSDETVEAFLKIMEDPKNRPVLVHCKHGVGRAVLFSAIYRIEYEGWPNERARRASRLILYKSSFDSNRSKGIFLRNYTPRLRRAGQIKLF
ncbi:MAG: tyrosine-protein phosphatase [Desulfobacterales bacterium]|nr:tyrosine-protein phosphatase [Desulfobacterales bacterium]